MKTLTVTSSAFQYNQKIPGDYACDYENKNPPLTIEGVPEGTKSLALIFDDPDAVGGTFDHWVVWNIPPTQTKIGENTVPGVEGLNSDQQTGYVGPCPPPGKIHRYVFRVFALDTLLNLGANSGKEDLEKAMEGHILAKGELVGLFGRPQ
ncbi:MAG: YbhB/YbcL family Raf kinase inhibitor-like protein [Methanocella sp.]|jgi:Raf kinase inhibitor-like YbhB/YbcL family protein